MAAAGVDPISLGLGALQLGTGIRSALVERKQRKRREAEQRLFQKRLNQSFQRTVSALRPGLLRRAAGLSSPGVEAAQRREKEIALGELGKAAEARKRETVRGVVRGGGQVESPAVTARVKAVDESLMEQSRILASRLASLGAARRERGAEQASQQLQGLAMKGLAVEQAANRPVHLPVSQEELAAQQTAGQGLAQYLSAASGVLRGQNAPAQQAQAPDIKTQLLNNLLQASIDKEIGGTTHDDDIRLDKKVTFLSNQLASLGVPRKEIEDYLKNNRPDLTTILPPVQGSGSLGDAISGFFNFLSQ